MKEQFLKVAVKPETKAQIDILSAINRTDRYALVGDMVNAAWSAAKSAGLVNDAMLANIISVDELPRPDGAQAVPVITISTGA